MKTCWLQREGNPHCIVFMAGWGMAPEPFVQLPCKNADLLLVYDYRDLESRTLLDSLSDNDYSQIFLLAWSMGVWVAATCLADIPFAHTTAIGGTCRPVDNTSGIPTDIFSAMIHSFSEDTLNNFYAAMFGSRSETEQFMANLPGRTPAELKEELICLQTSCRRREPATEFFSQCLVTGRDRIFPARNQIRAWGRDNCTTLSWPHFPFYHQKRWATLLSYVTHG